MKKMLIKGILPVACVLALSACSGEDSPANAGGKGGIAPVVDIDTDVTSTAPSSRAEGDITVEDLTLTLSSLDGSYSESWTGVSAFPADQQFSVGDYTLAATYGAVEDEGFDKPCYQGSAQLKVTENNTTTVKLTASMANTMVSVVYTDAFKSYMTNWNAELHANGGEYLYYGKEETRPVYMRPGSTVLNVSVTKPNGQAATLQAAEFVSEPRHHYHITVDLRQEGAGDATMVVSFDDTVDKEDIIIELSDELMNAPAPTVTTLGFTPGTSLAFVAGMKPADLQAKFNIMARGGLASVMLTTDSPSLIDQGWPAEVDLANTPANLQSRMQALGFSCLGLWKNPDKMAVADLTGALDKISGNGTNKFTLVVTDRYRKVSEPVELTINIEPLELTIAQADQLMVNSDELSLTLGYNGSDPANNVTFQYKNDRGTWSKLTVKSCEAVARSGEQYTVVVSVPADDKSITVRAAYGSTYTPELVVNRIEPPFKLACNDLDVFATRAALTVTGDNETPQQLAAKGKIYLSTDGGKSYSEATSTVADGGFNLSSLQGGTTYLAYVLIDGIRSRSIEFTTEQPLQIPNGGLDEWSAEKKGDYQYLWNLGGGAWNTLNALTTSTSGSGSGNGLNTGGTAYKASSGTIPANGRSTKSNDSGGLWGTNKSGDGHTQGNATLHNDRQHSGTNAALIRTVGWGSGNSASASTSGQHFGTCQNKTPGELYLGSVNGTDPVYGYGFGSRPTSLEFYYHYDPHTAGNGDYGRVELKLYDAQGNEIASATKDLTEQATYTLVTLPIEYKSNHKAAKMSLIFKSSVNDSALAQNLSFWNVPGVKNVSGGEYFGSELYIDDVTLNY